MKGFDAKKEQRGTQNPNKHCINHPHISSFRHQDHTSLIVKEKYSRILAEFVMLSSAGCPFEFLKKHCNSSAGSSNSLERLKC